MGYPPGPRGPQDHRAEAARGGLGSDLPSGLPRRVEAALPGPSRASPALSVGSIFLPLSLWAWEKEQGGQGSEGAPEVLLEGGSALPPQVAFNLCLCQRPHEASCPASPPEISFHCLLGFRSPGSLSFPQLCGFHSIVSGLDCCPAKFKAVLVIKILESYLTLHFLPKIWGKFLLFFHQV